MSGPFDNHYALFGTFTARPGRGDELAELLVQAGRSMPDNPDCLLYLISRHPEDPDAISVYETWTSREAHARSLDDEATRELIARAKPLIAGVAERVELRPLGGKGLD